VTQKGGSVKRQVSASFPAVLGRQEPRFGVGTELGSQDAVRQLTGGHEIRPAGSGRGHFPAPEVVVGHGASGQPRPGQSDPAHNGLNPPPRSWARGFVRTGKRCGVVEYIRVYARRPK
jgi:hypothetical protein